MFPGTWQRRTQSVGESIGKDLFFDVEFRRRRSDFYVALRESECDVSRSLYVSLDLFNAPTVHEGPNGQTDV